MSARESDTATTIAALAGIVIIIIAAILTGYNHTLAKLGLVAIAGIAGFSLNNLVRRS